MVHDSIDQIVGASIYAVVRFWAEVIKVGVLEIANDEIRIWLLRLLLFSLSSGTLANKFGKFVCRCYG